jgi:hypothetical protein
VPLTRDLRPIYTAADERAAAAALEDFAAAWGDWYPAIVKVWRARWAEFIPFLAACGWPPIPRWICPAATSAYRTYWRGVSGVAPISTSSAQWR